MRTSSWLPSQVRAGQSWPTPMPPPPGVSLAELRSSSFISHVRMRLYKGLCPSVRVSVYLSVRPSVRPFLPPSRPEILPPLSPIILYFLLINFHGDKALVGGAEGPCSTLELERNKSEGEVGSPQKNPLHSALPLIEMSLAPSLPSSPLPPPSLLAPFFSFVIVHLSCVGGDGG